MSITCVFHMLAVSFHILVRDRRRDDPIISEMPPTFKKNLRAVSVKRKLRILKIYRRVKNLNELLLCKYT